MSLPINNNNNWSIRQLTTTGPIPPTITGSVNSSTVTNWAQLGHQWVTNGSIGPGPGLQLGHLGSIISLAWAGFGLHLRLTVFNWVWVINWLTGLHWAWAWAWAQLSVSLGSVWPGLGHSLGQSGLGSTVGPSGSGSQSPILSGQSGSGWVNGSTNNTTILGLSSGSISLTVFTNCLGPGPGLFSQSGPSVTGSSPSGLPSLSGLANCPVIRLGQSIIGSGLGPSTAQCHCPSLSLLSVWVNWVNCHWVIGSTVLSGLNWGPGHWSLGSSVHCPGHCPITMSINNFPPLLVQLAWVRSSPIGSVSHNNYQ